MQLVICTQSERHLRDHASLRSAAGITATLRAGLRAAQQRCLDQEHVPLDAHGERPAVDGVLEPAGRAEIVITLLRDAARDPGLERLLQACERDLGVDDERRAWRGEGGRQRGGGGVTRGGARRLARW